MVFETGRNPRRSCRPFERHRFRKFYCRTIGVGQLRCGNGTSGKVSLLNRMLSDNARLDELYRTTMAWPNPVLPENSRHLFKFIANGGPYLRMLASSSIERWFARPDSIDTLSDEPLNVGSVVRMAHKRLRIADGRATPGEIAAFEDEMRDKQPKTQARGAEMTDKLIELRREPMIIGGAWLPMWNVMLRARELGVQDGEFHPETILTCGGGNKGAQIPADYGEQILKFTGPVRSNMGFGMSEMSCHHPMCEANNYHINPWVIPLLLDDASEKLLPRQGVVTGRYASFDLGFDGRWGGLITGDRITLDFTQRCPCGRLGAFIDPEISRFAALGEDDKIGCAGTIDSYIRGVIFGCLLARRRRKN